MSRATALCDSVLIALSLVLGCMSPELEPATSAKRAAAIDAQVRTLRHDTATVFDRSAEGAALEAAYDGSVLRRIHIVYYGEMGRTVHAFYFDSSLFFVAERDYRYDRPLSGQVVDSTIKLFDLTLPSTPRAIADSLRAEATELLSFLTKR